jgi:aspartate racemase
MKSQSRTIGILGGMGPQASAYIYKLLIDMSIREFGAKKNEDFPEVLIYSIPVPDFISNVKKQTEALRMLKKRVRIFNSIRVANIGIACNTAHVLLPDLQLISHARFVSMIEAVCKNVKEDKVALLATPTMLRLGIYQKYLMKRGVEVILPDKKQEAMLEEIIRKIIKGEDIDSSLEKIANALVKKKAKAIILGCTELPLAFPKSYKVPVYNSSEVLVRVLLRNYYK